jgi:hypothetical protein
VSTHLSVDAEIRAEADRLLESGLRDLLDAFGEMHITGSYVLELMTWRDLDIHVVRDDLDQSAFFRLGRDIAALLRPHRMHFRDETAVRTPGLPRGLYWGVYLGDERKGAWKLDIWTTMRADFELTRRFGIRLLERLTPDTRETILAIKSACWQDPDYRKGFSSADIYNAVLDHGVKSVDEFSRLRRRLKSS